MSKKLLIGSLALSAGILALVFGVLPSEPMRSYGVADFLLRDARDERVKVGGQLVRGSLCEVEPGCGYRFKMADYYGRSSVHASGHSPAELSVLYEGCVVPDTFRDIPGLDVSVVVEGERCQTCHDFKADQIMAKCPAKYEMSLHGGRLLSAPPPRCSALEG